MRPYVGACAPVWLALTAQEELDAVEAEGKAKWGSSADRTGNARVIRTEVEGYGVQGESGAMQEFGELGRECWRQMEELRGEWEERIKD